MKVLMVGPVPPPYTGQSVSFEKLKCELQLLSPDVVVVHVNTAPKSTKHVTGMASINRVFETVIVIFRVLYVTIASKVDTLYITKGSTKFGFYRDFCVLLCKQCFARNARLVVHLKGGNYDEFYSNCGFLTKFLVRHFLKCADSIIVLGPSLVKMYDFMPDVANKISVIENALTSGVPANRSHTDVNRVTILFLSNLIYSKGYLHLTQAVRKLVERGVSGFEVKVAGAFMGSPDDPEGKNVDDFRQQFFSELESKDLSDKVEYVGVVAGQDKEQLLSEADIFVLPTKYHVEGQPVSIIEAMAHGCAIVSTKYRSIPDLVTESVNANYVDYADPESIANGLEDILMNRPKLRKYCESSRRIYENQFTWPIHFEKMKKVLGLKI